MRLSIKSSLRLFFSKHSIFLQNLSYMTVLQVFMLIAPLITYPYLVKTIGKELYGNFLTAQMLASYASLLIDFGSNSVCAKHVSQNRKNIGILSEIISSVYIVRSLLWFICFLLYLGVVYLVPAYRAFFIIYLLSYGLTFQELLFPQYYFQGIEEMKYITYINISVKLVFILLVFIVVKGPGDFVYLPILYSLGYFLGGVAANIIVFKYKKVPFRFPKKERIMYYVKDCLPIFGTDLICSIKDKFNYLLVGSYSGMGNVVVYDLGTKLNGFLGKPTEIIKTVLFPKMANEKNLRLLKRSIVFTIGLTVSLVLIANLFLPQIVHFFIHEEINLLPIRLFTLAPIILSLSVMLATNLIVAFGYNRFLLYSILITTFAYLVSLAVMVVTGRMSSLYSFVAIALVSYCVELVYRILASFRIIKLERNAHEKV